MNVVPQEELKIANLFHSLLIEEEMMNREEELIYRLEKAQIVKVHVVWLHSCCQLSSSLGVMHREQKGETNGAHSSSCS